MFKTSSGFNTPAPAAPRAPQRLSAAEHRQVVGGANRQVRKPQVQKT